MLLCPPHTQTYIYIYIYIVSKVKLATVVEGNQMAPFSIATIPRCRGGRYSFPWIAPLLPLIRTLYHWVLSKEVSSTIFIVFGMARYWIEPRSPGPLANTLPARPMSQERERARLIQRDREKETGWKIQIMNERRDWLKCISLIEIHNIYVYIC